MKIAASPFLSHCQRVEINCGIIQLLTQIFSLGCKICVSSSREDALTEFRVQCREIVERVSTATAAQSSASMDIRIWVAYISAEGCIGEVDESKKICEKTILALCQGLRSQPMSGSKIKQMVEIPVIFFCYITI